MIVEVEAENLEAAFPKKFWESVLPPLHVAATGTDEEILFVRNRAATIYLTEEQMREVVIKAMNWPNPLPTQGQKVFVEKVIEIAAKYSQGEAA